jgi:hemoglobin
MAHAVEKAGIPADVGSRLMQHFTRVAEALRNRD